MPQHEVHLDSFRLDRTEVTNAQYAAFLNEQGNQREAGMTWLNLWDEDCLIEWADGGYRPKEGYADHPVVEVTWYGASAYCTWARKRLPTEAEWEKAARGTERLLYPWGDTFDGNLVNSCDVKCTEDWSDEAWDDGYAYTAPVGSYQDGASPYGALDMAGNVGEWVADWYGEDYYGNALDSNPLGPGSGERRVIRGGSWYELGGSMRAAQRSHDDPAVSDGNLGFRCAHSVVQP
jgi:formylglycine-generating enzyme required for sulfatase activity